MARYALTALVTWFRKEKRELPWRLDPSPYAVWVSEVMLQQTQVKTVIPYFYRWMEVFPTLIDLAKASEEEVIKNWEGLGYYSRARQLHQGAKWCVDHTQGQLPKEPENLKKIKGIGPYTQGALLSFAFHQKAAAVDGNVLRVMSRLKGYSKDISLGSTKKEMEKLVLAFLPNEKPWEAMEALIELGALICTKKPTCHKCPLINQCQAFLQGKTEKLPVKKKGTQTLSITRYVVMLESEGDILVKKNEPGKIMAGLWEFPYFENALPTHFSGILLQNMTPQETVTHTFTRYRATLFPYFQQISKKIHPEGFTWIPMDQLKQLPFSSGHRKLLKYLVG